MASRNGNISNNNLTNNCKDKDNEGAEDDGDDETKDDEDRKLRIDNDAGADADDEEGENKKDNDEDDHVDIDGKSSEGADGADTNGEDSGVKDNESDESKENDDDNRSKNRRKKTIPRKTVASDDLNDSDEPGNGDQDGDEGDSRNFHSNGIGLDDDEDGPVILKAVDDVSDFIDEDDVNDENDDYEGNGGGIDRDLIFQKQQQLRLQQLQQQQRYQQQIQLQFLQDQQEAKLMELHQQYQQANGLGGDHDQDDSTAGLSLDWQEGFTDDNFPMITDLRTGGSNMSLFNGRGGHNDSHSNNSNGMSISIGSMNGNSNHNSNNSNGTGPNSGKPATPDFLQPRGPGRPRKGNKSNDISPCPECNKVFVRPDVLKLHYRSVHLNERHPCNMCPKIFKWPGDLSKHKRTKHAEQMAALANAKNAATS